MPQNTEKKQWINWFVPLLLILTAVGIFIFYPTPEKISSPNPAKPKIISNNTINDEFEPTAIANSLVSRFFNGSEEDVSEQLIALEDTLNYLTATDNDLTKLVLTELKNNNINNAIKTLIKLTNEENDLRESAKNWINIGNIQNLTSARQALQAYQKASEFDPENSNAWNRQGHIYRQLKQFDDAEKAYKKVQSLANQGTANKAFSLANFGLLNQSKGNLEEAEKAFIQALEIYTNIENEAGIASVSENLARMYKNTEQFEKAETNFLKALDIHQKQEQPQNIATIHSALGSLYQTMKLSNKAQTHYEKALEINLNNNFKENIASLYSNLGILAEQNGKLEKSKEYFQKSLELNKDTKRDNATADQYGNLAILNRNKKDFIKAEEYHLQAIDIYRHNNHTSGVISQQINLGFLYKVWKRNDKACQVWRDTMPILKRVASNRTSRVEELITSSCK